MDEISIRVNNKRPPTRIRLSEGNKGGRDRFQTAWHDKYEQLADFYEQHGHLKLKYKSSLYNWVSYQRTKRAGKRNCAARLSEEQIRLLDEIDFPWAPIKTDWQTRYNELANFYKTHGHLNVEYKSSLYNWMIHQRNNRGSQVSLSDEQIRLLDKINFSWTPKQNKLREEWNTRYKELALFYTEHGHTRVTAGSSLYYWTVVQRRKYAGIKPYAALTNEQTKMLDSINFVWNPEKYEKDRLHAAWLRRYQKLDDFFKIHGHLKVEHGSSMYTWMVKQRQRRFGKGGYSPLTEEQVQMLDDIGFSWEPTGGPRDVAWNRRYQELAEFYKQNGHPNVVGPSSLYTWMINQRQRRAGKGHCVPLTDKQIRLLDEIEFPWAPGSTGGTIR